MTTTAICTIRKQVVLTIVDRVTPVSGAEIRVVAQHSVRHLGTTRNWITAVSRTRYAIITVNGVVRTTGCGIARIDCTGAPIIAVTDALKVPDNALMASLTPLVDLPKFSIYWALEVLLSHGDGLTSEGNNYAPAWSRRRP